MGIKKLNKLLFSEKLIKKHSSLSSFILNKNKKNLRLAIDISPYLYKYLISTEEYLYGIFNQVSKFLQCKVIPIYVFDGKPPILKDKVILMRKNRKQKKKEQLRKLKDTITNDTKGDILAKINKLEKSSTSLNSGIIKKVQHLLNILGVEYIDCNEEADIICAALLKADKVDAIFSEDTDFLFFGCQTVIKNQKNIIIEYNYEKILEYFNITKDQFQEICILMGCDYSVYNLRQDPLLIIKNICFHGNIQNWLQFEEKNISEENNIIIKTLGHCEETKKDINTIINKINNISLTLTLNNKKNIIDFRKLIHFFNKSISSTSFQYHKTRRVRNVIYSINRNLCI